jgi:hypothetical protein
MKKQWKYEAGELVELSAAGRARDHNHQVRDMIGMIMSIEPCWNAHRGGYPYKIKWFGYFPQKGMLDMKEYEIKRVRGVK